MGCNELTASQIEEVHELINYVYLEVKRMTKKYNILRNYNGAYIDRLIIYAAFVFWVCWSIYWAAMSYFGFHQTLVSFMVLGATFGFAAAFLRIIKKHL